MLFALHRESLRSILMNIGVALPHYGDDVSVEGLVAMARECERLGFHSVWLSDHLTFDLAKYGGSAEPLGSLDPLATLAHIAGATSTVRLGTMVLCNEFRHPVVLAKEAATLHLLSGGRLELGIGAGWYETEFTKAGIAFPRPGVRLRKLREAGHILKGLLTGDAYSFSGTHYAVHDLAIRPVHDTRPTVWIGGKGDRAIGVVADVGDGWNAAWFQDVDAYIQRAALLRGTSVRRSIGQYVEGSAQEQVDRLWGFAKQDVEIAVMCFSTMPFGLDDPDDIARFAQDVLPNV